ncbi:MAG: hypothetical protein V4736_10165 [Bdellovibrionota bacterium]
MRDFFLVVPLGAEGHALKELESVAPYLVDMEGWPLAQAYSEIREVKGGIEFKAELATGLQLHYWLKVPVRILLRLYNFRCRDRRDFRTQLDKGSWQEWLSGTPVQIKAESTASKVWNESWVQEETQKYLKAKFGTKTSVSKLYLRSLEDRWTVSLDLTGEPLFKRGWATLKEKAPIRENLATIGLRELIGQDYWQTSEVCLADPFLGSGTILAEGFHLNDLSLNRSFAFESEPFCPKLLRDKKIVSNYRWKKPQSFKSYFGTEIDEKTFTTATANLCEVSDLKLMHSSFEATKPEYPRTWILTNPPYEMRVNLKSVEGKNWLEALANKWQPEKISFFYPKDRMNELGIPKGYRLGGQVSLSNGGINVQLTTLIRD